MGVKVEYIFEDFSFRFLADEMKNDQTVAVIGSRSVKDRHDVSSAIWDFSNGIRRRKSCRIVSGGAYGADQSGMEGALNMPLGTLDPVIPVSSRKIDAVMRLLKKWGKSPILDTDECKIETKEMILLYPDFSDGYHPSKYHKRDRKIVNASEIITAFWDGVSKGTKATFRYAVKIGKQTVIIKI